MKALKGIVTVSVKRKHIDTGQACLGTHCPVALALKDKGILKANGWVYSEVIGTTKNCKGIPLPPKVTRFINDFDCQRPVKPFSFRLNLDAEKKRQQ